MENKKEDKYFYSIHNYIIISENPFQIAMIIHNKILTYEIIFLKYINMPIYL